MNRFYQSGLIPLGNEAIRVALVFETWEVIECYEGLTICGV